MLLPQGADAAAAAGDGLCVSELAAGVAAVSASLARMYKREQARSSPPSSPDDSPRASAMADLDSVDDELPPLVAPASLPADRQQSLPSLDPVEVRYWRPFVPLLAALPARRLLAGCVASHS